MKWTSPRSQFPASAILKQAGFQPIVDYKSGGKASWVRLLGRARYPRFHIYIEERSDNTCVYDLHLDQKQSTIAIKTKKQRMHAGEYDGKAVEEEMSRIQRWWQYIHSNA